MVGFFENFDFKKRGVFKKKGGVIEIFNASVEV